MSASCWTRSSQKTCPLPSQLSTKVVKTEVNGAPAYLMTTKVGDDAKIYVSADGKARLLRVEGPKGQLGTWDFTEWDAVTPVAAPAADQVATTSRPCSLSASGCSTGPGPGCDLGRPGRQSGTPRADTGPIRETDDGDRRISRPWTAGPEPRDQRSPAGLPQPPADPPPCSPGYSDKPPQQIPMLTAHKPGIVPLRPLQFGDILDGAVKAVRFNPKSMVGLSALVLAAFLVPSAALGVGATHLMARGPEQGRPEFQSLLGFRPRCSDVLHRAGDHPPQRSPRVCRGPGSPGPQTGCRSDVASHPRAGPPLLGLILLTLMFSLLATALLIGPGVLLLVNDNIAAGLILILSAAWASSSWPWRSRRRSSWPHRRSFSRVTAYSPGCDAPFALTKGAAFWRVLGITLLAGLLAGLAGCMLGLPSRLAGLARHPGSAGRALESGQIGVTFVSHLSALLSGAITTPFLAAVTGLLYIDRRMRLEALDVVLLREAQTNPAPKV